MTVGGKDTPFHHGSHQDLLWSPVVPAPPGPGVDAIIVPTARTPPYLDGVADLAMTLGCTLVTLHSTKWTNADQAARHLPPGIDLIAIDVPETARLRLPQFTTSRLLSGTVFARKSDLSPKRNLAIMLSHMLGWSRVMFLDDDITGLDPDDVRRAASMLDIYHAVGLYVGGFPDHSVVCHAYRQAGGDQQSFIGGGALAVAVDQARSFFPEIYNDDWFFLLDGNKRLRPTAVTGQVLQYPYDPFRNPDRARAEELGDVLAEGLYWLLDQDRSIVDADRAHWARFLARRKTFIENVLEMVRGHDLSEPERERRIAALKGALGRLALITPELCEQYLHAWISDQPRWHRHLAQLPGGCEREDAIAMLSAKGQTHLTWRAGRTKSQAKVRSESLGREQVKPQTGVGQRTLAAAPVGR